jgi:hypothetical protein
MKSFLSRLITLAILLLFVFLFFDSKEIKTISETIKNDNNSTNELIDTKESIKKNKNEPIQRGNSSENNNSAPDPKDNNSSFSSVDDCLKSSYNNGIGNIEFRSYLCFASGWYNLARYVWELSIKYPECKEINVIIINKCVDQKGNIVYCQSKSTFDSGEIAEFRTYKDHSYLYDNDISFNGKCGFSYRGVCDCQGGLEIETF